MIVSDYEGQKPKTVSNFDMAMADYDKLVCKLNTNIEILSSRLDNFFQPSAIQAKHINDPVNPVRAEEPASNVVQTLRDCNSRLYYNCEMIEKILEKLDF